MPQNNITESTENDKIIFSTYNFCDKIEIATNVAFREP